MASSNVIAELAIKIGLISEDAVKGLDEADKKVKGLGERAKATGDDLRRGLASAFGDVARAAFPFLGAAAAINALTNAQQGLYRAQKAAKESGVPVREYIAWGRAAENLGFSAEEAQSSLVSLQESMQQAALTGRSAAAGVMTYLGVRLFDANGKLKTSSQLLQDLSKILSKMPIARARAYGQMMGLSPNTIALLREGKELTKEFAEALERGPGERDAKKAWEVQKSWNSLKQTGGDLARNVFILLYPALQAVVKIAERLSRFLADHSYFVTFVGSALTAIAVLSRLEGAFKAVGIAASAAIRLIGLAFKSNPVLAGIMLIVGGIIDLINFIRGADSIIGTFFDLIGIKADSVRNIFKKLGEILLGFLEPFKWVINGLLAIMSPDMNTESSENGFGAVAQSEIQGMRDNTPKQAAQPVRTAPNIVNNRNSARTVNSTVSNVVTVNALGGDPKAVASATQKGIRGGMQGYDRTLITSFESGFNSK